MSVKGKTVFHHTGEVLKRHKTRKKALAQHRAIMASKGKKSGVGEYVRSCK